MKTEEGLRRFCTWLLPLRPDLTSFTQVARADCLEFGTWMTTLTHRRTGNPLAPATRRVRSQAVLGFFRDGYLWEWPDMPDRPLLINGDLPNLVYPVPRFIPATELAVLTDAIRRLECPYQRASLLVARWSGARRSEVRMLELDCLDTYPDDTPRLRLPAGKNYTERLSMGQWLCLPMIAGGAALWVWAHRRRASTGAARGDQLR